MRKWRKITLLALTFISSAGLLLLVALHFLNKGKAVELSRHIEVGEQVVIPSAKGNLIGSYFRPPKSGKFPAVIMVNGSGRTSYRTAWDPEKERYFWKPVTEMLNEAGYAVLLMEKRGINGSEGHWEKESFEDRADNVLAAVDFLKNMEGIDPERIGLMGHSQGGWIVQLAAYKNPDDISFIVLSRIIDYDPDPITRSLKVPVYSIYAENDHLVLPLTAGLKVAGNDQYVVHIVPDANQHFFQSDFCFSRSELMGKEPIAQFLNAIQDFMAWERNLTRNWG